MILAKSMLNKINLKKVLISEALSDSYTRYDLNNVLKEHDEIKWKIPSKIFLMQLKNINIKWIFIALNA